MLSRVKSIETKADEMKKELVTSISELRGGLEEVRLLVKDPKAGVAALSERSSSFVSDLSVLRATVALMNSTMDSMALLINSSKCY